MLVLTRKRGQGINIDKLIKVQILGVSGNKVRIGIEAPPEVSIHRDEIYESIQLRTKVDGSAAAPIKPGVDAG